MKKKMDNKGFSLVELIIVIAIMLVLVGILAPQFVRYVARSRAAADVTNAQEIAAAINAAIADGLTYGTGTDQWSGFPAGTAANAGDTVTGLPGITTVPTSRVNSTFPWVVTWNATDGVTGITLGGTPVYPNADNYPPTTP